MENTDLIEKAIRYVKKSFKDNDMSVQKVADNAGFSLDYFNRIFLSHTGFTVMAYVNYMRIKKAIELLRTTDRTILEIALEVGYDSHEGFTKAFKKYYHTTPNEYRKQYANQVLSWGELTDASCAARFLHDNQDFQRMDPDFAIDHLLEKDSMRHGYLCAAVKYMGLEIVAPWGNIENGFIGIVGDRKGGMRLELVNIHFDVLAEWIKRFKNASAFYSHENPQTVKEVLESYGVHVEIAATPQSVYLGERIECVLPKLRRFVSLFPFPPNF